jgi:glutamate--cysteine ligase
MTCTILRERCWISRRQGSPRGRAKARAVSSPTRRISSALKDSVETGKVPADELLELYRTDWAGDLTRIYGEFSY